jgi:hypothetical protein
MNRKFLLMLNYILFDWYYKRVPAHFLQWTFFKSVKLLIENYKHQTELYELEKKEHIQTSKELTTYKNRAINAENTLYVPCNN